MANRKRQTNSCVVKSRIKTTKEKGASQKVVDLYDSLFGMFLLRNREICKSLSFERISNRKEFQIEKNFK